MILESTIQLGDDNDCEQPGCTGSYNAIWYSFDTATDMHAVEVMLGCFGSGPKATVNLPGEVVNVLAPYREGWPGSAEVNDLIDWLVR